MSLNMVRGSKAAPLPLQQPLPLSLSPTPAFCHSAELAIKFLVPNEPGAACRIDQLRRAMRMA